jgi:hypothetical protein
VSDFSISNQIADYRHWETIELLGPKNDTHSKTPTTNGVSWSAPTRTMADGALYFDWPILNYINQNTHSYLISNGQNLLPNRDTAQGFCTIIHKSLIDFGKGSGGSEYNTALNPDGSFQARIGGGNPMSYVICK